MATENEELMDKCFPRHLHMGTARTKENNNDEEEEASRKEQTWKEAKYSQNKEVPRPSYSLGLPSPWDHYSPNQWMN